MDAIRNRLPLGTWVRGHVHGNEFAGRVTGWGSEQGVMVDGVCYPVSCILEVEMEAVDEDFLDDGDAAPRTTPTEAT